MAFLNPETMFYGKAAAMFYNDDDYSTINDMKKETNRNNDVPNEDSSSSSSHQRNLCSKLKTLLKKQHQDSGDDDFIGTRIKPLVLMASFTTFVTSIFNTKDEEKIPPRRLSFNRKVADMLAQDPNLKFILHIENDLLRNHHHNHNSQTSPVDEGDEKKRRLYGDEMVSVSDSPKSVSKGTSLNQDKDGAMNMIVKSTTTGATTVMTSKASRLNQMDILQREGLTVLKTPISLDDIESDKSETNVHDKQFLPSLSLHHYNDGGDGVSSENTSQSTLKLQKQFKHCEGSMFTRVSPPTPVTPSSTEDTLFVSKDLYCTTEAVPTKNYDGELSSINKADEEMTNKTDTTKSDDGWFTPPSDIVDNGKASCTQHADDQYDGSFQDELIHAHPRSSDDQNKVSPIENDDNNDTLLKLSIQQQRSTNKPESNPTFEDDNDDKLKTLSQSHLVKEQQPQQQPQQQQYQPQPQPFQSQQVDRSDDNIDESNKVSITNPKDTILDTSTIEPANTTQITDLNSKLVARSEQVKQRSASPFEAISIALNETTQKNTTKVMEWKVHHIMDESRRSTSPTSLSSQTSSPFEPISASELSKNNREGVTCSPPSSSSSFEDIMLP